MKTILAKFGNSHHYNFLVKVIEEPLKDVIAKPHENVVFEAEISFNAPGIVVKWFKGNEQLHEGDKYVMKWRVKQKV